MSEERKIEKIDEAYTKVIRKFRKRYIKGFHTHIYINNDRNDNNFFFVIE